MSNSSIQNAAKRVGATGIAPIVAMISAATVLAAASANAAAAKPDTPAIPHSVPVTVDAATTAYLVLDLTSAVCTPNPTCMATLPAAANLLAKARAAHALVVYSKTVNPGDQVLPQVAPQGDEQTVAARADKFFGTELDDILKAHGIKTVVMVGSKTNGAIMYTAFGAGGRGYTTVVAQDGVSSNSAYIQHYSLFQLQNAPGFPNPANTPLAPRGVTLSTARQITFGH